MTGALVVTTISPPNAVLRALAKGAGEAGMPFIAIGDAKSPADFALAGCDYHSLERQGTLDFATAVLSPTGHYARKNIGYLVAMAGGADHIVETDDDNFPLAAFFEPLPEHCDAGALAGTGWTNIYGAFGRSDVWPRGFPLDALAGSQPVWPKESGSVHAPIQQALAQDNPDVDAIYRLTRPLPVAFDEEERRIALGKGSWCPFNSQATVHHRPAFSLLYLPAHCSFRMTDIWRSFVAQRIAWENDWHVLFREPTVRQERNDHDLMRDFADEIPGYLANRAIAAMLEQLPLEQGEDAIPTNLRRCYGALIEAGHVGEAEMPLLDAWLDDCAGLSQG